MVTITKKPHVRLSVLQNDIASLSTGGVNTYYTSPEQFFACLEEILEKHELAYEDLAYPAISTSEGRGILPITFADDATPVLEVFFTWYRMPSYNWEIVCYLIPQPHQ